MQVLIFATNNENKVKEVNAILKGSFEIKSLKQAEIHTEIPEPHDSLEANATEKSSFIFNLTGKDCFSEDTGLEVYALNGEPGVRSARFAGEGCTSEQNISLLLEKMKNIPNREARFRTVISLYLNGQEYQFEGICNGSITAFRQGQEGFGYDPVFIPDGSTKTFAEMTTDEKNKFSHRKKAMTKLIDFLKKTNGKN